MWRRIPCFVNFPFPSIQHGILVAKGGQHNGGTSKHKKYISHRQHQDTARVRFGESSEFFLRLWNAAIVWATHRQNAYTCKFLFMLWSAATVLATRTSRTYFLWVAFLSSIEGCSFHILSFHFCFCCCAPLCPRLPLNSVRPHIMPHIASFWLLSFLFVSTTRVHAGQGCCSEHRICLLSSQFFTMPHTS